MNKDLIKSAYDAMSPDEAARQRMLKRLTDKGGQSVKKEYSAHPQRSGGWIGPLAAILVLAVLATGLVTILRSQAPTQLQDDPTETTVPTGNAEEAIEAFMSTPFYQASVEYYEWLQNGESGTYVNRMTKQQEIADRYGLKHYNGDDKGTDNYDYFLEELELKSFLREDVMDAVWSIESCWWYDQSRFNVGGSVTMTWEKAPRTAPIDFNLYRTKPDYLLPACGEMGRLDNYQCFLSGVSTGESVILALGNEKSYVILPRTDEIIFIVVDNWKQEEGIRAMTKESLICFANLFTYEFVKGNEEGADQVQHLSLIPQNVSRTGLTATFSYSGNKNEVFYNDDYHLERYENGSWVPIPEPPGYSHNVGNSSYGVVDGYGMVHDWTARYGELPDGRYRICKPVVSNVLVSGTSGNNMVYGIFSLPDDMTTGPVPLEDLPEIYSAEQAMQDGCFVMVDGVARHNKDVVERFAQDSWNGISSFLRVVEWINGDESACIVSDVFFDGEIYTITWRQNDAFVSRQFKYLEYATGDAEDAEYLTYEHYILTNGNAVESITICSDYTLAPDPMPQITDEPAQVELMLNGEVLLTTTDFDRLEKICRLFANAEFLGYEPKTHSVGVGLNLVITDRNGEAMVIELDPDNDLCRINGEFVSYGKPDEPSYIEKLWDYLGIEAWPEEVYEIFGNAYKPSK